MSWFDKFCSDLDSAMKGLGQNSRSEKWLGRFESTIKRQYSLLNKSNDYQGLYELHGVLQWYAQYIKSDAFLPTCCKKEYRVARWPLIGRLCQKVDPAFARLSTVLKRHIQLTGPVEAVLLYRPPTSSQHEEKSQRTPFTRRLVSALAYTALLAQPKSTPYASKALAGLATIDAKPMALLPGGTFSAQCALAQVPMSSVNAVWLQALLTEGRQGVSFAVKKTPALVYVANTVAQFFVGRDVYRAGEFCGMFQALPTWQQQQLVKALVVSDQGAEVLRYLVDRHYLDPLAYGYEASPYERNLLQLAASYRREDLITYLTKLPAVRKKIGQTVQQYLANLENVDKMKLLPFLFADGEKSLPLLSMMFQDFLLNDDVDVVKKLFDLGKVTPRLLFDKNDLMSVLSAREEEYMPFKEGLEQWVRASSILRSKAFNTLYILLYQEQFEMVDVFLSRVKSLRTNIHAIDEKTSSSILTDFIVLDKPYAVRFLLDRGVRLSDRQLEKYSVEIQAMHHKYSQLAAGVDNAMGKDVWMHAIRSTGPYRTYLDWFTLFGFLYSGFAYIVIKTNADEFFGVVYGLSCIVYSIIRYYTRQLPDLNWVSIVLGSVLVPAHIYYGAFLSIRGGVRYLAREASRIILMRRIKTVVDLALQQRMIYPPEVLTMLVEGVKNTGLHDFSATRIQFRSSAKHGAFEMTINQFFRHIAAVFRAEGLNISVAQLVHDYLATFLVEHGCRVNAAAEAALVSQLLKHVSGIVGLAIDHYCSEMRDSQIGEEREGRQREKWRLLKLRKQRPRPDAKPVIAIVEEMPVPKKKMPLDRCREYLELLKETLLGNVFYSASYSPGRKVSLAAGQESGGKYLSDKVVVRLSVAVKKFGGKYLYPNFKFPDVTRREVLCYITTFEKVRSLLSSKFNVSVSIKHNEITLSMSTPEGVLEWDAVNARVKALPKLFRNHRDQTLEAFFQEDKKPVFKRVAVSGEQFSGKDEKKFPTGGIKKNILPMKSARAGAGRSHQPLVHQSILRSGKKFIPKRKNTKTQIEYIAGAFVRHAIQFFILTERASVRAESKLSEISVLARLCHFYRALCLFSGYIKAKKMLGKQPPEIEAWVSHEVCEYLKGAIDALMHNNLLATAADQLKMMPKSLHRLAGIFTARQLISPVVVAIPIHHRQAADLSEKTAELKLPVHENYPIKQLDDVYFIVPIALEKRVLTTTEMSTDYLTHSANHLVMQFKWIHKRFTSGPAVNYPAVTAALTLLAVHLGILVTPKDQRILEDSELGKLAGRWNVNLKKAIGELPDSLQAVLTQAKKIRQTFRHRNEPIKRWDLDGLATSIFSYQPENVDAPVTATSASPGC